MIPYIKYVLEKNEIQVKQLLDSISSIGRQRAQYLTARFMLLLEKLILMTLKTVLLFALFNET